jgi:hypothetical protein
VIAVLPSSSVLEISCLACEEEWAISSPLFFAVSMTDFFALSTPDQKSEAFQSLNVARKLWRSLVLVKKQ